MLLTLDKIAYDIEIKITGFNCMISIDGITLNMQFNNTAFLKYCSVHTARVHGPCSRAVFTACPHCREHGPWDTGARYTLYQCVQSTRVEGPLLIMTSYLCSTFRSPEMARVTNTAREHGSRPILTDRVYGPSTR